MESISERCHCGASVTITTELLTDAKDYIKKWRKEHAHVDPQPARWGQIYHTPAVQPPYQVTCEA